MIKIDKHRLITTHNRLSIERGVPKAVTETWTAEGKAYKAAGLVAPLPPWAMAPYGTLRRTPTLFTPESGTSPLDEEDKEEILLLLKYAPKWR